MKLQRQWSVVNLLILVFVFGCRTRGTDASIKSAETSTCVDRAISALGIDESMKTDPAVIEDILKNDMLLDDLPSARQLFAGALDHEEPLGPMLRTIRDGILTKHPAINEFLCVALGQGLIVANDTSDKTIIARTIHHTYLLNALVQKMGDSLPFMSEVKVHLMERRGKLGIKPGFIESTVEIYQLAGDLFTPAKAKTIDVVIDDYETTRRSGNATKADFIKRRASLILNIMEASITDRVHGLDDNAIAGVGLAINPLESFSVTTENQRFEYGISREWASLYQTWNLAFITGNLTNLNLLYPKLLIPMVMCADGKDYLYYRTLALWASINFHLFAKLNQREVAPMSNNQALAKAWGQINRRHAERYVFNENNGRKLTGFRDLRYIAFDDLEYFVSKAMVRLGVGI